MEKYYRTDIAAELINDKKRLPLGVEYDEDVSKEGFYTERVRVSSEGSEKFGKPVGSYLTVKCGKISEIEACELDLLVSFLAKELGDLAEEISGFKRSGDFRVLAVGLGNEKMTPDAVGPLCATKIEVTRQLEGVRRELFEQIGCCSLSAFAPGVTGVTGIETSELVLGAVRCVEPHMVIAVDSLAARSAERLGTTVQLSTAGVDPGSGVGNRRRGLNEKNLGVPVIAIGVPTVVDSSALIREALELSDIKEIPEKLERILENRKNYFVAPKDCDALVKSASELLARAVNTAFGINF